MAVQLEVLVSVDADEPAALSDIAEQLTAVGMDVRDVHDGISVITGTVDEAAVGELEQIPGVLDVEQQRSYRLPPPDAELQ